MHLPKIYFRKKKRNIYYYNFLLDLISKVRSNLCFIRNLIEVLTAKDSGLFYFYFLNSLKFLYNCIFILFKNILDFMWPIRFVLLYLKTDELLTFFIKWQFIKWSWHRLNFIWYDILFFLILCLSLTFIFYILTDINLQTMLYYIWLFIALCQY